MGDESCIYPEQGYDCEDNMILDCMEVVCCGLADPLGFVLMLVSLVAHLICVLNYMIIRS